MCGGGCRGRRVWGGGCGGGVTGEVLLSVSLLTASVRTERTVIKYRGGGSILRSTEVRWPRGTIDPPPLHILR